MLSNQQKNQETETTKFGKLTQEFDAKIVAYQSFEQVMHMLESIQLWVSSPLKLL